MHPIRLFDGITIEQAKYWLLRQPIDDLDGATLLGMCRKMEKNERVLVGRKLSADEALALDYVLGILIEPDAGRVLVKIREDLDFGFLVSQSLKRFSGWLGDGCRIGDTLAAPPAEIWDAIHARTATMRDS